MFQGRLAIAVLSAACATSALAVTSPTGGNRTQIQSQVAQPPDPAVDPRTVVVQTPAEPPPTPPPPQGEPATAAPESNNSVVVGEPGPQTGSPPVAATIPANTVRNRDDGASTSEVNEGGSDVRTDGEEGVVRNAATGAADDETNITGNDTATTGDGDSTPWWPILGIVGVVAVGGIIWALKRRPPDPIDDEPEIPLPDDVPDEPVPPQPFVPFSVRPSLDRAYGAGPPPRLDWDGPRTQIRTRLEPGAITWSE